ncbi:uncharacterized protein LOC142989333 [Genypterus blacodes]|uniref:uncharacterized protein LOC142989333 n=1 Tax=Genypterus blacodes TaxID=154954 RepID=UPI003F76597D
MCAALFRLITALLVCSSALSGVGNNGVVQGHFGGSVTIQCRHPDQRQDFLYLVRGVSEDDQVLVKNKKHNSSIKAEFKKRTQVNGDVPNVDIFITNLTVEDTGAYWCIYQKFTPSMDFPKTKGSGSVLLVVAGPQCDKSTQADQSQRSYDLALVLIAIFVIVLFIICMVVIIWLKRKISSVRGAKEPRRLPTNDVYEDMRATIRR